MRRVNPVFLVIILGVSCAVVAAQPQVGPLSLWYRQPAKQWVEALAVGNGRLGAMVFGGIAQERIQLNEDTLWAGGPYDPANPDAIEALPKVRELIFAGRYREAQNLISQKMMAKPFEALLKDHAAAHRRLFRRVTLNLGTTAAASRPTSESAIPTRRTIRNWRPSTSSSAGIC